MLELKNRQAFHEYFIDTRYEAGLVLLGLWFAGALAGTLPAQLYGGMGSDVLVGGQKAEWPVARPPVADQGHPDPTPCAGAPRCNESPTPSISTACAVRTTESTNPSTRGGSFRSPVRRSRLPSACAAVT